jgi:ParB/RepB/Spo0J family partition protein
MPTATKPAPKKTAKKAAKEPKTNGNHAAIIAALPPGELKEIDPALIDPHPHNRTVDPKTCKGLAETMKEFGQIETATVRPHPTKPGRFQLGAGCRRWHAAKLNGSTLRCLVRPLSDEQLEAVLVVENLQREAPDPREEATQIRRLAQLPNASPRDIAAILGKDDRWVQRRMKLTQLTDELHDEWVDPKSEIHHLPVAAMELLAVTPPETQTLFLQECEGEVFTSTGDVAHWIRSNSCSLEDADFLDDPVTFIPGCGPGCANSSAACGLLNFAEFKDMNEGEKSHCLNESCFNKRAHLARIAKWKKAIAGAPNGFIAITEKYDDEIELGDGHSVKFQQRHQFWAWKDAKKTMEGAVLFLVENRKGHITRSYKLPPKNAKSLAKVTAADGSTSSLRTPEETVQGSIHRVQGKRFTELRSRLDRHLQDLPEDFGTNGLQTPLIPLVAYLGTNERELSAAGADAWQGALAVSEGEALKLLWGSIRQVLHKRLNDRSYTDRKCDLIKQTFQDEMRHIARITGFDFDGQYAQIAHAGKLPASLKCYDLVTLTKVSA